MRIDKMKNTLTLNLLSTIFAFENEPGWKIDEDGKVELKDGDPVYINSAGQEMTVGAGKISELNAESKGHREAKEKAIEQLNMYDGIDPEAARKALETVKKIDAKQLIDSGKVDEVKSQISNEFKTQITEKEELINQLVNENNNMRVDRIFENSQYLKDNLAVPIDMFQATFKGNFKVNDKKEIECLDRAGNRIMSKVKVGEYADPDEALQIIIDSHPQKDTIIKANSATGSGNNGGGGSGGSKKTMLRADYKKLEGTLEHAQIGKKIAAGEIKII